VGQAGELLVLDGTPEEIGERCGRVLGGHMRRNVEALVRGEEVQSCASEPAFRRWVEAQWDRVSRAWPALTEEVAAVARAAGIDHEEAVLLNLRAWQYRLYSGGPAGACSSVALTLADGSVVCGGALDDPPRFYCGPVMYAPDRGLRCITFPIAGTSWGNRGMNAAGLSVGISSQILPGLRARPGAVSQDLAMRALLQSCTTVAEVRDFCREYPFTMNLVCADAHGGILCMHQTMAGSMELPADGHAVLTNHVADDAVRYRLWQNGVTEFPESPTSRARRGRLLDLARNRGGRCTEEEVRDFLARRDDADPGSVHNATTIALTFSNPVRDPGTLWIMQPVSEPARGFRAFRLGR
jgi:hypothetical protein